MPRHALSRMDCMALLATGGGIGRLVTSRQALPVAIPVGYQMWGEDVLFTSTPTTSRWTRRWPSWHSRSTGSTRS